MAIIDHKFQDPDLDGVFASPHKKRVILEAFGETIAISKKELEIMLGCLEKPNKNEYILDTKSMWLLSVGIADSNNHDIARIVEATSETNAKVSVYMDIISKNPHIDYEDLYVASCMPLGEAVMSRVVTTHHKTEQENKNVK